MSKTAWDDSIKIVKLTLGIYETNAYILICRETGNSVIVDAPGETDKLMQPLNGTTPRYILMTHNHMDHVGALLELKTSLNVPLAAHKLDADKLPVKTDKFLSDEDMVVFGNIRLSVLHTPGHTQGSLCFLHDKDLFSGDTLFPGGPGKTGSPDAFRQILNSITTRLLNLPPDMRIHPGHGESTTFIHEKSTIVEFCSRTHPSNLCGDVLWASS
ncbi:MBL fold metallo-hydrolase [Thermodesulfobacteriota bacterium]